MPPAIWLVLVLIGSAWADSSATRQAPSYSATSIVNAASNQANAYAPNTFVSVYGVNLAFTTRSMAGGDISANTLPTVLPGTGVRVWVGSEPTFVYYVSPTQINVLLPTNLKAGPTQLRVQVDATYGPPIPVVITTAAPAFFQLDAHTVIAAHADSRVVTAEAPATRGELIVLYATGLGITVPKPAYGEIPMTGATLADLANFSIVLDGRRLPANYIAYAGVAPGFAGLYQVNMRVPDDAGADPEICVTVGGVSSPGGLHLPVRASAP